ncbi:hypothetical protein BCR36DRAFT_322322 [Piromyces finnis]|uniref:Ubiquitin-like domain-containing protein n=1 Tax=Piromyces finnis TaxID=1754191 RepID=A0A1Y1VGG8_9FUNG|nr:hypothetical protein BCR36DRAFT_322322 [Piromyces finnis]|eukprot:ORX54862.1 hypothetical protein BCR36DRAFT_322322 [Piromyces finnis]
MKQEKLNNIQNNNNINNGNVLNDTEINYEINKSKLKDAKNKKSNIVNLSISTLTGQQFFIKVLSSYTISDVKDLIQEKEGLAAQTQILIYQDKTLDCDSMTIEDYGIENGSSIKLMIKLYDGLCNIEQEDTKKDNTIVLLLCKKKGYLYLFETSLKSTSQLSNESFDSSLFDFYNSFDDKSITSSEMSSKPTSPISTTYSNSSLFNKESLNFLNSQTSKSSVYSSNCDDNISVNNSSKNIMEKKNDKKKVLFNNKSRSLSINYDLLKIIENATLCANKSGYNVTVAIQDLDTPVYSYQSSLNSFSDDDTFTDIYNNKTYKSESISSNSITSSNSSNQISSQINSNAHSKQSTSLSLESSIEYLYNSNSDSNIYVPIYEYNLLSYHSHQTPSLRKTKSEIFNIGQKMQNKNNILTLRKQKSDSQLYKSFMEYLNKTYQPHFHDQINSSNKSTNSILFPCYFLIQDLNRNNSSKSGNITIENKDATSFNKIKSNHKLINFKNNSPSLITPSNTEIRSNTQNSININNIKQNNIHMINTSNSNLTKNDNNKTNNNTKLLSKSYSQVIHPVSQIESSLKQSSFPFIGNKMAGRGVVDGHPQNSKLEETLYTERPSTSVPIVTYYKDIYNPNLIKSSFNIYEDTISNNNNKISLQQEKIDKLEENIEIISINKNFNNAVTIEGNSDIKHISNNGNKQSKKNRNTISLPEISINNSNNKTEKKNPFPKGNIHSFPDIYKHIPNDKIYKPQITIKYKDSDAEDDIDRYVNEENQSYYCPRKENYKYSSNKIKKLEPKIYHKRLSSNQTNYDNKEVFHDTNAIMKKIESEYSINDYSEDEDNIILDYFDQGMNYKELKPEPINSLNNENYHYIPEHELQNLFQKEYINNHNNNYDDEYIYFYDEKDIPFNKIKSFISTKNIKTDIKEKSLDLSFRKKNSDCQNENNKLLASPLSQNNKTNEEINDSSINKSINEALSINNNNNNNNNNMKKKNVCEFCHKKIRITATYKCKCNKIFCATHRYSECHNCTYNYKQNGKKDLEKNNPLVVKDKISKI